MKSQLCTQYSLSSEKYQYWASIFGNANHMHRKIWEWAFICETLNCYGVLKPGALGLGFAVGEEPLTSIFASQGARILATDLDSVDAAKKGWMETGQHARNKDILNRRGLCDGTKFDALVDFDFVDMNSIPSKLVSKFDFCWSSCAFEHLGSISNGLDFVLNSLATLKPGGIAVHTTEFNVSSNDETIETGPTVLFRQKDILMLRDKISAAGYFIDEIDFGFGSGNFDGFIDVPPYAHNPHLKLKIDKYTVTSIGLIAYRTSCT